MRFISFHFWKSGPRIKVVNEWQEVAPGIRVKQERIVWESPEEYKSRKPDRLTICFLNKWYFTLKIPWR